MRNEKQGNYKRYGSIVSEKTKKSNYKILFIKMNLFTPTWACKMPGEVLNDNAVMGV